MAGAFVIQNIVTGLLLTVNSLGGPGYPVQMYPALGTSNQSWAFGGLDAVISLENGLALTAHNYTWSNCMSGVGITVEVLSGKPGQRWTYSDKDNQAFTIYNIYKGTCTENSYLAVANNDVGAGSPLFLDASGIFHSETQAFQLLDIVTRSEEIN